MKTVHKSKRADIWEQNEQLYRGIIAVNTPADQSRVAALERLLACYPTDYRPARGQDYQFKYSSQLHEQVMAIVCG